MSNLNNNTTQLEALLAKVNALPEAGSGDVTLMLQDKIITPTTSIQVVTADSGYDGLDTVTVNAMPTATQATPSITVNSSGLITATATQTAGYVAAGTKSATKQLAFQAAKTITPGTANQTAVSSGYYTGGAVTVKGDANLVAGNIKSGVSIFGVNGTYVGTGDSGGGEAAEYSEAEDDIISRTISGIYMNDRVTKIGTYAFCGCANLTSVSFSVAASIGNYAFSGCPRLTSVSFPACTSIGNYAFSGCPRLTSVSFPACKEIGVSAFYNCSRLTSVSFPDATSIGSNAFKSCSKLTSVSFPVTTSISMYAFYNCVNLRSVSFPVATSIGNYAFAYCYSLTLVSFPDVTSIGGYAFYNCTKLSQIYLTASSVCVLANSNAFSYTSIWSTKGSIFVPSSLVTAYKSSTNWAYFSNRIFGV